MCTEAGILVFIGDGDDGDHYPHPTHDRQNPHQYFMVLFTNGLIDEILEAERECRVVGGFNHYAQREQQQAGPIGRQIWSKKACDLSECTNSDRGTDLVVLIIICIIVVYVVLVLLHNIFDLVLYVYDGCALTLFFRHIDGILSLRSLSRGTAETAPSALKGISLRGMLGVELRIKTIP